MGSVLLPRWCLAACLCLAGVTFAWAAQNPGQQRLELQGQVFSENEKPLPGHTLLHIDLFGVSTPFSAGTLSLGGKFKFKKLAPGAYTIAVRRRGHAEVRQTVDVVRGFADAQGRVSIKLTLSDSSETMTRLYTVSARSLSLPPSAWDGYRKAQKDLNSADPQKVQAGVVRLEKAVERYPNFLEGLNLLGTIYYKRREFNKAEDAFRRALALDVNAFEPLVNLGGTLLDLGRYTEALPINLNAVTARHDDALANSQLGINLFVLGHYDNAIVFLNRAKKLDPGHFSHPQMLLAEIYMRQGRRAAAAAELREFIRLHPDDPSTPKIRAGLARLENPPQRHEEH